MSEILWEAKIPVMNNRLSDTYKEAIIYPIGELKLISTDWGITNKSFDEDLVVYDSKYHNNQSLSKSFKTHIENIITKILPHIRNKQELIVEVGCGSGYFVELLQNKGLNAIGYDPSYNGQNPLIIKDHFNDRSHKKAEFLVLRHVLEHIPNPKEFLSKLFSANGYSGRIYIEVPSLDWIFEHNSYFDFTYEHCNYFSEEGLSSFFDEVIDKGVLFGGQYQYIIADISKYNPNRERKIEKYSFNNIKQTLIKHRKLIGSYESLYVWGASGKGATFCQLMCSTEDKRNENCNIDGLVDINPEKFGKYVPQVGNKVYEYSPSLGNEKTIYLVLNDEYLDEINELCGNRAILLEYVV